MKVLPDKNAEIFDFFFSGCPVSEGHEIIFANAQVNPVTVISMRIPLRQSSNSDTLA